MEERRQTVEEYLEVWLAQRLEAKELKATTARGYRSHIDHYLVPHLGHIKLRELRGQDIDRMILKLKKSGARERPLSETTIQRVLATLRKAMNEALMHGLIGPVNPVARSARKPKKITKKKVNPWTADELSRFLTFIGDDTALVNVVTVAALTGLRRGELVGLEWGSVDLTEDGGSLTVSRTLVDLGADGVRVDVPKSDASKRTLAFGATVAAALKSQRLTHPFTKAVFPGPDSEDWRPNALSDAFERAVKRAGEKIGLRPCRLHDLRHYAATQALAAGVPLATVKYRLGHAQVSLTADLYGHLEAASDRAAADAVERLLQDAR
jgi:integrase